MNAILGYAQLLQRDRSLGQPQQQKVDVILSSGDHLLTLINNILEMSKIEAGRTTLVAEPLDLQSLLEGVRHMFTGLARAKGVDLVFENDDALPPALDGDAGRIRQVVINLLSNAMKFTEKGRVLVRASTDRTPAGTYLITIAVEDTGHGIEPENLEKIFHVFEQSSAGVRAGGSGLGLTISKELARLMGGDLTAVSHLGVGSTFTFSFKAKASATPASSAADAQQRPTRLDVNQPTRRVLVVDDRAENLNMVGELLRQIGFEIRLATSGEEAIEVHDAWQPELVLMDVRMPGIGGLEAIRRLRAAGSKAVLVAFTASLLEGMHQEALAAGARDVVVKPYREADLLRRIGELLDVRYVYDADNEPATSGAAVDDKPAQSLSRLLKGVPPNLIDQLRDAVVEASTTRIEQLATEIGKYSKDAATEIRALAREFLYDRIESALNEAASPPHDNS
jgi:CheY-like chemotaxis protein